MIFLLAAIRQKDDQIGRLRFQIDALRKENVFLFFIFVKCYLFWFFKGIPESCVEFAGRKSRSKWHGVYYKRRWIASRIERATRPTATKTTGTSYKKNENSQKTIMKCDSIFHSLLYHSRFAFFIIILLLSFATVFMAIIKQSIVNFEIIKILPRFAWLNVIFSSDLKRWALKLNLGNVFAICLRLCGARLNILARTSYI